MKKVAIIYNYVHHFRVPLFNLLSQNKEPDYCIISGITSEIDIKKADLLLKTTDPLNGGLKWQVVKNFWFFKRFLFQPSILRRKFFRSYDTHIYLGSMYYISTWISAFIARCLGKKVIFWTHGFIRNEENLIGLVRSIFYRIPHEILVYGERAKNILIEKGFQEKNIKLIYNSLDLLSQNKVYKKREAVVDLFPDSELPIVGFIGRLTPQKKIDSLIELLEAMPNGNKFNLLIVGEGEQSVYLKKLVGDRGLGRFVVFMGAVYDEQENCNLISMMDVVISPGEVGLTAIHSMTYGTPVLTHDRFDKQMPEFEAIIPGVTGAFFDNSHPIKSLQSLLPHFLGKRDQYSHNCRKVVKEKYNKENQLLIFNSVV